MDMRLNIRPLRWLILLWVSLVYLWGLSSIWQLVGEDGCGGLTLPPVFVQCRHALPTPYGKGSLTLGGNVSLLWITIFTGLMVLQGVLLWISLAERSVRRRAWLFWLAQGVLVFAISLLVQQENIALSLCLALLFAVLARLRKPRPIIVALLGTTVLFIVSITVIEAVHNAQGAKTNWWYSIWNLPNIAALLLFVAAFLLLYIQQLRSHAELEVAHAKLKISTERIEELTRLTERQRLARALHDTLAQDLAGLIRQLEVADAHQTKQHYQRAQEIIRQAILRARSALAEARSAIEELRDETMRADQFSKAVQEEICRFTETTGISCVTEMGALVDIPPWLHEHALRMLVEGLSNVMRHAQAHQVWVSVVRGERMIALEVRDDGVGFDPTAVLERTGHYGLIGLRERACLCGGTLEVNSTPGTGTTIQLSMPANDRGGGD